MKLYYTLIAILAPLFLSAQENLTFNKKFNHCENKWVALPPDTSGSHAYGFVYIDPTAGLTLDLEGSFTIDIQGKYHYKKREPKGSVKYRLDRRNNVFVAIIPEIKFIELNVRTAPDWLSAYKQDENSTNYLYIRGYTANAWGDCNTALAFLEKAYQKEPDFRRLRPELAYSYNCLGQFQNAIKILKEAASNEPLNAYINKELIYAQVKSGLLNTAIETYKSFVERNAPKNYDNENAFNILNGFYLKKDLKNFEKWLAETDMKNDKRFTDAIEKMKTQLKQ